MPNSKNFNVKNLENKLRNIMMNSKSLIQMKSKKRKRLAENK